MTSAPAAVAAPVRRAEHHDHPFTNRSRPRRTTMARTDRPERRSVLGSPARYAVTLVLALLATAPAFEGALDDRLSLATALVRFLIAFTVLWALGALFGLVVRVPGSAGADR
jgi:hypothetical protein